MEASTSTEQLEGMRQGGAAGDQLPGSLISSLEISQPFQPMTSSLLDSAQSNKIYPQYIQASPRAGSGSSKINPMVTAGHQGPRNNQHHMRHWNHAELRAKKKFYKWSLLAILVTSLSAALFLFLFYWK